MAKSGPLSDKALRLECARLAFAEPGDPDDPRLGVYERLELTERLYRFICNEPAVHKLS